MKPLQAGWERQGPWERDVWGMEAWEWRGGMVSESPPAQKRGMEMSSVSLFLPPSPRTLVPPLGRTQLTSEPGSAACSGLDSSQSLRGEWGEEKAQRLRTD